MYGDPASSWGIGLDLTFADAVDPKSLQPRWKALAKRYPHLGTELDLVADVDSDAWGSTRARLMGEPFEVGRAVVRAAISADRRRLLVAAHHGVCDGLGLVALGGALAGVDIVSHARGIGDKPSRQGFWLRSGLRAFEALTTPPPRFPGRPGGSTGQESFASRELPLLNAGSAGLVRSIVGQFGETGRRGTPVVILGASRRRPGLPEPDRRTAYLRMRVPVTVTEDEMRRLIADCPPEPDFPETTLKGFAPRLTHLLRARLGATAMLSNLGRLEGPGLVAAEMFPAASGPHAIAFGLASTPTTTTVTLRTRDDDIAPEQARSLLDAVVGDWVAARQ